MGRYVDLVVGTPGLVSYWPLDDFELGSTYAIDCGRRNNFDLNYGIGTGIYGESSGPFRGGSPCANTLGDAVRGLDVAVANGSGGGDVLLAPTDLTIEFSAFWRGTGTQTPISKTDGAFGNAFDWQFQTSAGKMNGGLGRAAQDGNYWISVTSAGDVLDSEWMHWVMTFDSSTTTLSIYRNGVVDGSSTSTSGTRQSAQTYLVRPGWLCGSFLQRWNGKLGQVSVCSRALTAKEIRERYLNLFNYRMQAKPRRRVA